MEKARNVPPKIKTLLKEVTPMWKGMETAVKIHVVRSDICTNIETDINSDEMEGQNPTEPMCRICTICGDLPVVFGKPKGKPKPVKREKTEEEKKKGFCQILGQNLRNDGSGRRRRAEIVRGSLGRSSKDRYHLRERLQGNE